MIVAEETLFLAMNKSLFLNMKLSEAIQIKF